MMADNEKPKAGPPESPTTARELDFDDDEVQTPPKQPTSSTVRGNSPSPAPRATDTQAPPQPVRASEAGDQNLRTLKDAFPAIEDPVIKAVLVASGGQIEPAFNALLTMSDPDSQHEPAPPPQPPRPVQTPSGASNRSQLEADELYARQLAEHYQHQAARVGPRDSSRDYRDQDPRVDRPRQETGLKPNELYDDREHSFLDDDLPVIRENIRKGFLDTQAKVNSFITNLKKKIDGEDEEDETPPVPPPRPGTQRYGVRPGNGAARRSADRERYDADPEILSDDFTRIHMHDETVPARKSPRPQANPDLFKPTPPAPGSGRKVSFQEGRPEIIGDSPRAGSGSSNKEPSPGAKSKWQPLAAADPNPVSDHDPFSLGDSDEDEPKRKEVNVEEGQESTDGPKKAETGVEAEVPATKAVEGATDSQGSGAKPA